MQPTFAECDTGFPSEERQVQWPLQPEASCDGDWPLLGGVGAILYTAPSHSGMFPLPSPVMLEPQAGTEVAYLTFYVKGDVFLHI